MRLSSPLSSTHGHPAGGSRAAGSPIGWAQRYDIRLVLFVTAAVFFLYHYAIHEANPSAPSSAWDGGGGSELTTTTIPMSGAPQIDRRQVIVHAVVYGDYGSYGAKERRYKTVARQVTAVCAATGAPDLVVSVGDAFYREGVVNDKDPHLALFQRRFRTLPSAVLWYGTLGNHDCAGNASALVSYRTPAGSVGPTWVLPSRYYAVELVGHSNVTAAADHDNKTEKQSCKNRNSRTST